MEHTFTTVGKIAKFYCVRILSIHLIAVIALCLLTAPTYGDDDQDWALEAVQAGKAVSLVEIMRSVEQTYNGRVYEVILEHGDETNAPPLYRINIVSSDGKLMEILIDTATGDPVGVGGQGIGEGAN